ncbi:MAG TPA: hypothetical protein VFO83_02880 [Aggregicoccus sp.]|nr:hypothetical protein [Aggregicoccus sp.]
MLLATGAGAAEPPRAPPLVSWKRTLCLYTLCFLEPLIPDLRYERGPQRRGVLSWPLHPWATPPLDVPGPTLILSPFVEPQLTLGSQRDYRLLAGGRAYVFPDSLRLGALLEGAALWGTDGRGGVAGVGLAYDLIERHRTTQPWTLALVYRRTWTQEGPRSDWSFDVTVPLRTFWGAPRDVSPQ